MQTQQALRQGTEAGIDLLRLPVVGPFLRWRYGRRVLQFALLLVAVAMILHGLLGPRLAPKNLATLLGWVHYRGLLVLALLVVGNVFCMACPFTFVRDVARRFFRPALHWPRAFRNKWVGIALLVGILFVYEAADLWGSPWWTAWLIVAYFAGALVVDSLFKNASFCKYVCPLGQFNFAASTLSPFEVKVRNVDVCATCATLDCIRGTRHPEEPEIVLQPGCELSLFQPKKSGNLDCTFCLDCVKACPHDNVGITTRLPGSELWDDGRKSGVGRLSRRTDLSVLALVFTFGALLNAFGMVSPVYALQQWMAGLMGTESEVQVLAVLFAAALVVEPVILLGAASATTRALTGSRENVLAVAARYAYALVPLGLGVWAAHYSFHLLTGLWTFIPVFSQILSAWTGLPAVSPASVPLGLPAEWVDPIEFGLLALGLFGSLLAGFQISSRDYPAHTRQAFAPWAVLSLLLWAAALWLLAQPMEMRGSFLGA